jgi:hypothetical protein
MSMGKHQELLTMVIKKSEDRQMYEKMTGLLVSEFVEALLGSCGMTINNGPISVKKMIQHYNICLHFFIFPLQFFCLESYFRTEKWFTFINIVVYIGCSKVRK